MLRDTNNNPPLYIKLTGFSDSEVTKFSAILDLAGFGLSQQWTLKNSPDSQVNVHVLKNATVSRLKQAKEQSHCFQYLLLNESNAEDTIYHDYDSVPMLHGLIEKLNSVNVRTISKENNSLSAKQAITEEKTPQGYAPTAFLKMLLKTDTPHIIRIENDMVYINPEAQSFYYSKPLEQLKNHFSADALGPVEELSSDVFHDIITQKGLVAQPLAHLIWYTAYSSSAGELMPSLSENDVIQLKDWPYLGVNSRHYIKLATYLRNNRVSLSKAIAECGIQSEIAKDFYNASVLAGLIETGLYAVHRSGTTKVEHIGVLNKIRNRLRR